MKKLIGFIAVLGCLVMVSPAWAAPGALFGSMIGPDLTTLTVITNPGPDVYDMKASDQIYGAYRFMAKGTQDVKSVILSWGTVTAPSNVTVCIETIDAATGKPSGTLYDAKATWTGAPTTGTQTITYAADMPTTGLVAGTEYAVVIKATGASTALNLYFSVSASLSSRYPTASLKSSNAGSTWAETANATPVCGIILDDDSYQLYGFTPYSSAPGSTGPCYSTSGPDHEYSAASKITTLTSYVVHGVYYVLSKNGTPAGDLVVDIRNTSNTEITGTAVTIDKDSLAGAASKLNYAPFAAPITLPAGTYYVYFKCPSCTASANSWRITGVPFLHANFVGSYRHATGDNGTMTDSTTLVAAVWLGIDADVAPTGGGGSASAY